MTIYQFICKVSAFLFTTEKQAEIKSQMPKRALQTAFCTYLREPVKRLTFYLLFFAAPMAMKAQNNLALQILNTSHTAALGDTIKWRVAVINVSKTTVTGVTVNIPTPVGTTLRQNKAISGSFNSASTVWNIGTINATQDSVFLDVTYNLNSEGVAYAIYEIATMDQIDANSTPNNGNLSEDDLAITCVSIPIFYNCSETVNLLASAPKGYSTYQWYFNGSAIEGATYDTFRINQIGDYTYTANTNQNNCPASLCCPIQVRKNECNIMGGFVFGDTNNNGVFDSTELGIPNVLMKLFIAPIVGIKNPLVDSLYTSTTTDTQGKYLFTNLDPNNYYVTLINPTGLTSSTGTGKTDTSVVGTKTYEPSTSRVNNTDNGTQMKGFVVSSIVKSSIIDTTVGFGLFKPTLSLGDFVFNDKNNNGVFDSIDVGISNVSVLLYTLGKDGIKNNLDDSLVASTLTDANGKYNFSNLTPNTYYVRVLNPSGYSSSTGSGSVDPSSTPNALFEPSSSRANNSDNGTQMAGFVLSSVVNLVKSDSTVDFGFYAPVTKKNCFVITNLVWEDINSNGVKEYNEPLLKNVKVVLLTLGKDGIKNTLDDSIVATVYSDSTGRYTFSCLDSSSYYLKAYTPPTMNSTNGYVYVGYTISPTINLNANQPVGSFDFGFVPCSQINPTFSVPSIVCANTVTIFIASGNYKTYNWDFGDGKTASGAIVTHTYAPAGGLFAVKLSVIDSAGCTGTTTQNIQAKPMVWARAGVAKTICAGDTAHLSAQGGTHYTWCAKGTDGACNVTTLDNNLVFNPTATPLVTTTYYVTVSNDEGCYGVDSMTITVVPAPQIVSHMGPLSTCNGGTIPVSVTLNQPIANYKIEGSAGYKDVVVNGNTLNYTAILNGTYDNVTLTLFGNTGCSVKKSFPIFLAGNPEADFVVIEPFCAGNKTTLLFTGSSTPAANLSYNLGTDGTVVYQSAATASLPAGDTTIVQWANWGSKLVKLTVNDGGCVSSKTQSIFVRKSPKTILANADTTVCAGTHVGLYGTAGLLTCVYEWSPSTGLDRTDIANPTATVNQTTVYTLNITDINGCQSAASVKITVDTSQPVFANVPSNITVTCKNIPAAPTVTATSGGVNTAVTFTETVQAGNCKYNYTVTRTWKAINKCGISATAIQIITVRDTVSPVFANVPTNITYDCANSYEPLALSYELLTSSGSQFTAHSSKLYATDNCSDQVAIKATEIVSDSTCVNHKTITRTWVATDDCGNSATVQQIITVRDRIVPVFVNVPTNITVTCSSDVPTAATLTATDNCSGSVVYGYALTLLDSVCSNKKTFVRTWSATDGCNNIGFATQKVTVYDTIKPIFANVPPDVTIECSDVVSSAVPTASDNCSASASVSLRIDTVQSGSACSYTLRKTFTATDACGNISKAIQNIFVRDTKAPVLSGTPANATYACDGDVPTPKILAATDNCDANPTVTLLERIDSSVKCNKIIARTWTATDKCGNASQFTQTIRVKDSIAPVIFPINPILANIRNGDTITMRCESLTPFTLNDFSATDNCGGAVIRDTVNNSLGIHIFFTDLGTKRGNCLIDGFSAIISCKWTAVDKCGNSSTYIIYIKVVDKTAPVLSAAPANITVNSPSDVPPAATLTATDNCAVPTVIETQTQQATGQNCDYIITRVWTATDDCGNTATKSQFITVHSDVTIKVIPFNETCAKNDGSVLFAPTPASVVWSDGSRVINRKDLKAGNYTVTVTLNGCTKVLSVTIGLDCTQPVCTPFNLSIVKTDATCGAANGIASVSNINGAITYLWSNGATTSSIASIASGTYTVKVSRSNIPNCDTTMRINIGNNIANCCTKPTVRTSVVTAKCGDNSGSITLATNADVKYTWSSNAGNVSSVTGLSAGTYTVTVSLNNVAACDTVLTFVISNDVSNCCTQDIIAQKTTVKLLPTCNAKADVCIEIPFSTINTFTVTDNGSAYANGFTTCNLGTNLQVTQGVHTLIFTSAQGCKDTLTAKAICTPDSVTNTCKPFLTAHTATITNACLSDSAKVCVDIPQENITDYAISVNGAPYAGGYEGCKFDTITGYQYYSIPEKGATGPYTLNYWIYNGDSIKNKTFANTAGLVDSMNKWNPSGNWTINPAQYFIQGGDHSKSYGDMRITQQQTLSVGNLLFNVQMLPQATNLFIKKGSSQIVFKNIATGCADTLSTLIACITPKHLEAFLVVGQIDTMCIDASQLLGRNYKLSAIGSPVTSIADMTILGGTVCVKATAKSVGVTNATYVIADEFGLHDTTYIIVHVSELIAKVGAPKAVNDAVTTQKSKSIIIDVVANDTIRAYKFTLAIVKTPQHGNVYVSGDLHIVYEPVLDYCATAPDQFQYNICTVGGCDTATVFITVNCDRFKIYNAFSPNADGVNDYFTIEGIEKFANNSLNVYDRWGNEVYVAKGYKNNWDGQWDHKNLPDGTYFYVFSDGEGNNFSGYIQLQR